MTDYYDPYQPGPFDQGFAGLLERGVRFARKLAIASVLAGVGGIAIGAALTDNWFAQIFLTLFAAVVLWVPMLVATLWAGRRLARKPAVPNTIDASATVVDDRLATSWRRLGVAAPSQRDRIVTLQRSLGRSRTSFEAQSMDADAHELCAMIDKRLPDLIDHELDSLAPDNRGRERQVGELIELVEQFVRHCGSKRDGAQVDSAYHAEVLKRRFEARLADPTPFD